MKVSIITVVYNNKCHIADCFQSLVNQSYKDVEYIVVDGGSTDGTLEELKENKRQIDIFISERDQGLYDALNKGIRLATGEIVGILHSDDLFYNQEVISDVVAKFMETNADLVYAKGVFVDRNNPIKVKRIYGSTHFRKWFLYFGWMPLHTTIFVRKDVFKRSGLYGLKYSIAGDYDISLRWFLDDNVRKEFLDEFTVKMRLGGKSTSMKHQKTKSLEDLVIIKEHGLWGVFTLGFKLLRKVLQYLMPYFIKIR